VNAFAQATDALFVDPNLGENAPLKAGGVGAGVALRIIHKSPVRMAEIRREPRGVADRRYQYPTPSADNNRRGRPDPDRRRDLEECWITDGRGLVLAWDAVQV